jgi:hypothetical protein
VLFLARLVEAIDMKMTYWSRAEYYTANVEFFDEVGSGGVAKVGVIQGITIIDALIPRSGSDLGGPALTRRLFESY